MTIEKLKEIGKRYEIDIIESNQELDELLSKGYKSISFMVVELMPKISIQYKPSNLLTSKNMNQQINIVATGIFAA